MNKFENPVTNCPHVYTPQTKTVVNYKYRVSTRYSHVFWFAAILIVILLTWTQLFFHVILKREKEKGVGWQVLYFKYLYPTLSRAFRHP